MIENEDEFKLLLYSQALSPAFGGTIAFVKETEPLLERGQGCSVFAPLIYTLFYVLISILCTVEAENLLALMLLWLSKRQRVLTPTIASRPLLYQGTHHTTSCMSSACH